MNLQRSELTIHIGIWYSNLSWHATILLEIRFAGYAFRNSNQALQFLFIRVEDIIDIGELLWNVNRSVF